MHVPHPVDGEKGNPTVSIILPTYNRAALLREAVASVFSQTFTDWELIVADDGSTDGTREFLESVADARLRPVYSEHDGRPTMVRIAGLRAASGTWFGFLDSDDLWLPDKLTLQLQGLSANPECGWSYGGFAMIDAEGRRVPQRAGLPYEPYSGWILEPLLQFRASAAIQTLLVRRSLFDDIGGFDASLDDRSDYDLVVRLAARSRAWAVPQVVVLIRDHGARTTSARRDAELFAEGAAVFRKVADSSSGRSVRALGRQQCARQLAAMAGALSNERMHLAAIQAIGRALRIAPWDAAIWRAAIRCIGREIQSRWRSQARSQARRND
jgi:glycosyltransferase involved in cell wall biosynthesis